MLFCGLNASLVVLGSQARNICSIEHFYFSYSSCRSEYDDFACLQIISTVMSPGTTTQTENGPTHRWQWAQAIGASTPRDCARSASRFATLLIILDLY